MGLGPQIVVVPSDQEMSRLAADAVQAVLQEKPDAAISLPTGSTPLGMFGELIERQQTGAVDLTLMQFFCLDEYLGVSTEDPNTLTNWLMRSFILPAGIPLDHVHTLPVLDPYPDSAARQYEEEIGQRGGLELVVLGIGNNGHVAYNEPGSASDSRTRVVDLTDESIDQARGYFDGATVPTRAMTVGIGTLLEARRLLLIASGEGKQEILRKTLLEPMTDKVPASWLRLDPERLTVIADEAAGALIRDLAD